MQMVAVGPIPTLCSLLLQAELKPHKTALLRSTSATMARPDLYFKHGSTTNSRCFCSLLFSERNCRPNVFSNILFSLIFVFWIVTLRFPLIVIVVSRYHNANNTAFNHKINRYTFDPISTWPLRLYGMQAYMDIPFARYNGALCRRKSINFISSSLE